MDRLNIPLMLEAQKIAFVEVLENISSRDRNLLSSKVLLMLFSGFLNLRIDGVDDSEVETCDSNTHVCESSKSSSRSHHTVNMSNRTWKVITNLAP